MKGSYTQSYVSAGCTAAYVGESTNITASQPTLGQLQLSDKKLAALIPISNDLLRSGGAKADNVIRNDLIRAMRLKEDATFIRSLGTSSEPRGLRAWATLASHTTSGQAACNTLAKMVIDVNVLLAYLMGADIPIENCFFIMSPRSYRFANSCTDLAGSFVFRQEMAGGKFWGLPYFVTSQISDAYSTDQSELYLCSKEYPIIAENESMIVDVFEGAAYYDGSSVVSGASRDETVLRAIQLHDFGCRMRGEECAYLSALEWGLSA
jgi:HK97 family phage major capsid protein